MPAMRAFVVWLALGAVLLTGFDAEAQRRNRRIEPAPQRAETTASDPDVELILDQVPLGEAVRGIAERTGYTYLFEEPLPGRVTAAVPARVSPDEANEILHALLYIKGFVALPIAEQRYKIVRWKTMAGSAPFRETAPDPERERSSTTRIQLEHADPQLIARSLKPLVPDGAVVVPYSPSGSLILAGPEAMLHRLIEIARQLDASRHSEMMVRRVRYKEAADLARQLEALTAPDPVRNQFASQVAIEVDERTNALLITGSPDQLEKLRAWIDRIDIPEYGGGEVQIVPVFFQEPKALADLLLGLADGGGARTEAQLASAGPLTNRDYDIVAHEPTHALVIRTDRGTFESLAPLIAALDREPRVLEIEATFYEITTNGTLGFGAGGVVPAIEPKKQDDLGLVFLPNVGLSPNGIPGLIEPDPALDALGGRVFSVIGETVVIPVLDGDGNPVFDAGGNPQVVLAPGLGISVLATDLYSQIDVTNRPSLLVAVGEESSIFVGDEIPIPQGSTNIEDLVTLGPSLRVELNRENVGTELTLKPRYNEGGDIYVDMAIELSLVRLDLSVDIETGPVLATRKVEGTFQVAPGKRAIVAGLESENLSTIRTGIPFLSAIPILGRLFTVEVDTKQRSYVVIALTANVMPTQEEKQAQRLALESVIKERTRDDLGFAPSGYVIRAAAYTRREIAEAARLDLEGRSEYPMRVVERESEAGVRFDLYLEGLDTLVDVARASIGLRRAGFDPEIFPLAPVLAAAPAGPTAP